MINIDSLSKYLKLYTKYGIEKFWTQIKYNSTIIDLNDRVGALALYNQAIWLMIEDTSMDTVKVFYLQDLINNYLKELAILNWIDVERYWWSSKLLYIYPSHSLFYNIIEWYKNQLSIMVSWWKVNTTLTIPKDFIIEILKEDFQKYFIDRWHLKKEEPVLLKEDTKKIKTTQDKTTHIWKTFSDVSDLF